MTRARVHEVSSPISLFPFIGILLCTMGALLVVLVAVSRSARDTAQEHVQQQQKAAKAEANAGAKQKLAHVSEYLGALSSIRGEAERKLRDEHARLSHVEDHIRRLQEKLRSLELAAKELDALEKEHYDDRAQAERETDRLNQLIEESRKSIADMQTAAEKEPASYALVPYEGPNGTFRRPIYLECTKDGILMQPEGVRITADDLRPPVGAGNPLAAALRAARDQLVQLYPKEGKSRDTEPYPLLIVRPEGLFMFDLARQAIEAGDFDLGFELVEQDWKLKYPQPNPQLASIEQEAIAVARARQEVLAAAAPRAYRSGSFSSERYGADDDGTDDGGVRDGYAGGGNGRGTGSGGSGGYPGGDGAGGSDFAGSTVGGDRGGGGSAGPSRSFGAGSAGPGGTIGSAGVGGSAGTAAGSVSGPGAAGQPYAGGAGGSASSPGDGSMASDGGDGGYGGRAGSAGGATVGTSAGNAVSGGGSLASAAGTPMAISDAGASPDDPGTSKNVSMMMGSPPPDADQQPAFGPKNQRDRTPNLPPEQRGKDWAMRQKPQRAVPVRRTIRVVVRQNQLAILADGAPNTPNAPGKVVPMNGDTVQSVDDFVKQVHSQIDGWGIAGNGLYWRPVIILTVGPDGQQRADDLARLLRNSGLELRMNETAANKPEGTTNETR